MVIVDDFDEDEMDEDIEQVCEVVCPHCKHPLHVIVTAADHDSFEETDL